METFYILKQNCLFECYLNRPDRLQEISEEFEEGNDPEGAREREFLKGEKFKHVGQVGLLHFFSPASRPKAVVFFPNEYWEEDLDSFFEVRKLGHPVTSIFK